LFYFYFRRFCLYRQRENIDIFSNFPLDKK